MAEPQSPTTLAEWLDDLAVRFLLNLPASELSSVPRLCFQIEEAHWFYEDFVRPAVVAAGAHPFPSYNLRSFFLLLCQHCPLLSGFTNSEHLAAYENFLAYKVRIPVRGAILLDPTLEKVLLVRGWRKGSSWSFPRGKINKDENDLNCALREVYEETGFDIRAAGLVPKNEDEIQKSDVTMREQHLRLFIFRDVPENTHFEARTRKEIGGIEWYNVRDLPGFRKAKSHASVQEVAHTSTNRFYMVAPFLGDLKRFIGEERRKQAALQRGHSLRNGAQDAALFGAESGLHGHNDSVDLKSEELKKLLSIGRFGGPHLPPPPAPTPPVPMDQHSNNLLAMLQSGATSFKNDSTKPPITPFEQLNTPAPQPHTPQPHHLRQMSDLTSQVSLPQFPITAPGMHQRRQYSAQTPNVFGPDLSNPPVGSRDFSQPTMPQGFEQVQQQSNLSGHGYPPQSNWQDGHNVSHNHAGHLSNYNQSQSQQSLPQMQPSYPQMASGPVISQVSQGPLGNLPAVPQASQLPQPKLSAQSMKLLDAFKTGSAKPTPAPVASGHAPRPSSTHSAALLNLFNKPGSTPKPPIQHTNTNLQTDKETLSVEQPAPPVKATAPPPDTTKLERRPTLNEITRTLPTNSRRPSNSTTAAMTPTAAQKPTLALPEKANAKPKHEQRAKQIIDHSSDGQPRDDSDVLAAPVKILQNPSNKQPARTSEPPRQSSVSHKKEEKSKQAMTILTRPGSTRGLISPPPSSPLRHENTKTAFQPQVLKRLKPGETAAVIPPADPDQSADKKDHLLALFGKSPVFVPANNNAAPTNNHTALANNTTVPAPVTSASRPSASSPTQTQETETKGAEQASNLAQHFGATKEHFSQFRKAPRPIQGLPPQGSTPPPAPRLEPEPRKPVSNQFRFKLPAIPNQFPSTAQDNLLNLLHKPPTKPTTSTASPTAVLSPNTPISPFTLSTPATAARPGITGTAANLSDLVPVDLTRSRIGSVTSVVTSGSAAQSGSGTETPKETKDFLLGFLNGVVMKEGGQRGGR